MNDSYPQPISHRQGGPPLGVLAAVSIALLAVGIAASAALGGVVPSPFGRAATVTHYFAAHARAARASAILSFGSAIPLAIYAATAHSRLRRLGVTAPGATIALVGGVLASVDLALSGLITWAASQPDVRDDAPVVRALHDVAFVTGGPAHVVGLGLLIAGIAVPALMLGLLPRPVAATGLVVAGVCELSTIVLITSAATPLVPLGRFSGLLWLLAVGFRLPQDRPRRSRIHDGAGTAAL